MKELIGWLNISEDIKKFSPSVVSPVPEASAALFQRFCQVFSQMVNLMNQVTRYLHWGIYVILQLLVQGLVVVAQQQLFCKGK